MAFAALFRMDLRRLILFLATFSALFTLANGFYAAYSVQRQQLMDSALEGNYVYVRKLAESVDDFLQAAQQQLHYSATALGQNINDPRLMSAEVDRLLQQTDTFNSVSIVDAQGWVLAISPESLQIKGRRLDTLGPTEALRQRRPLISAPYVSLTGNLLVLISQPITDRKGRYLGYIGGTIYLKQKSILNTLLGEHHYRDGSYLYVVDQQRRLLYHPEPARVGTYVAQNAIINAVLRAEHGAMREKKQHGRRYAGQLRAHWWHLVGHRRPAPDAGGVGGAGRFDARRAVSHFAAGLAAAGGDLVAVTTDCAPAVAAGRWRAPDG